MGGAGPPPTEAPPTPRIVHLFQHARRHGRVVRVSAPMVRYSKLPFRLLVAHYGADVVYTPMMLAHEFIRSAPARHADFSTHAREQAPRAAAAAAAARPVVIAQFASNCPEEFARAAELVAPWVDGVDLNCGCPQPWALREGIGCALMDEENAARAASMVRAAQRAPGMEGKSVSVKMRLHPDRDQSARWVERVQREGGVHYITVHGRTRRQRSSTPPDYDAIRRLRHAVRCPLVANGDAYTLDDVRRIAEITGVDGVMAARGLMENPALFAGFRLTPKPCVGEFLMWAVMCPIPFPLVLHLVGEMTGKMEGTTKKVKRRLMGCRDLVDLIDLVEEEWGLPR